ncbi:MAG: hypothetical protein F4X83_10440 [Chloroflexi bacterium]|nr:hypothetical protein [Chloroflexota bacterium]
MTSSIYLFLDTNVFLQCKELEEIDWRSCDALAEFDEIHLLVSLPVMNEIDKLKSRGNDRLGRRARKANGIIRDLVLSDSPQRIVRPTEPAVTLAVAISIRPTPGFLDYETADNQILGCVDAYRSANESHDVRFLTHDTGPMATARNQGVPLVPVPDVWLLDPEPSAAERRANELEAELKRLRQTQPQFNVSFVNSAGNEQTEVTGSVLAACSLTHDEVSQLIDRLRESTSQSQTRDWLESCENLLRNLHTSIQHRSERPVVTIEVANQGVCPAEDALIEIIGHGPILLGVPLHEDSVHRELRQRPIQLPSPPKPFDMPTFRTGIDLLGPRERGTDDPNAFYYKPERPLEPVSMLALECKQWRHGIGKKRFQVEIYVDSELPAIEGRIEFRIHARNLPDPVHWFVQVSLQGRPVITADRAVDLVEQTVQQARADSASSVLDAQFGRRRR